MGGLNIVCMAPCVLHGFPHLGDPGEATSLNGYLITSSFLIQCFRLFFVTTCSTIVSFAISAKNLRMNRGSQSSEAIPKSLQHRIRAFDLQPSVAVGMPSGSKYCCSPRAIDTSLYLRQRSSTGYREKVSPNSPSTAHERIFPRDQRLRDDRLTPRRQTPPSRTERFVQYPSILDLREVHDAVGLDLDVVVAQILEEDGVRFIAERSGGETVEGARPVDLLLVFIQAGWGVVQTLGQGAWGGFWFGWVRV